MTEQTVKRRPGRPATGHNPTRSVRIGPEWDEALENVVLHGGSISQIVTKALRAYNQRCRRLAAKDEAA